MEKSDALTVNVVDPLLLRIWAFRLGEFLKLLLVMDEVPLRSRILSAPSSVASPHPVTAQLLMVRPVTLFMFIPCSTVVVMFTLVSATVVASLM